MHCMKCGVEIDAQQVFCEQCLADMEKHPVKPDTPVILPPKAFAPTPKRQPAHHWRPNRLEETTARLRAWVWALLIVCLALLLALGLSVTWIIHLMQQQDSESPDPGQNYNTGSFTSSASTGSTQSTGSTASTQNTTVPESTDTTD